METERKHINLKGICTVACQLLLGGVFVFSGFVKAIDPLGSFYKLQDYLSAFGINSWFPEGVTLSGGIMLAAVEFSSGAFLLLGISRRFTTTMALLLMAVMTPLTLYLALADPVDDCGCFGDAVVLTNWQTFGKNTVLLAAALIVYRYRDRLLNLVSHKMEWMITRYTVLFVLALSIYCLNRLPLLDFRPYKIGTDIKAAMEIPEGAQPDVWEQRFILEKAGEQREFTLDNYPDSTWTFVEARSILKQKGYEPPIRDFAVTDPESGDDITDLLLDYPGYSFILVGHRIEKADDSNIDLINELYDYCTEHGYGFYALTSSPLEEIELWRDKTGAEYPFGLADDTTLKTIIRSNPGLLLLKEGVVLNKWSDGNLPDEYVLTGRLEEIPLGEQKQESQLYVIGCTLLWFIVPLLLVIGLDVLVVRRRMTKASAARQEEQKH